MCARVGEQEKVKNAAKLCCVEVELVRVDIEFAACAHLLNLDAVQSGGEAERLKVFRLRNRLICARAKRTTRHEVFNEKSTERIVLNWHWIGVRLITPRAKPNVD